MNKKEKANVWRGLLLWIYNVTDWLGLVPIVVCISFGILGLVKNNASNIVDYV